jgi:hypothetical protein
MVSWMQRKLEQWGRGLGSAAFTGQPLDPFATQNQVNQYFLPPHMHARTWGRGSLPGPSGPLERINPWFHGPIGPGNANRYEMRTLHDMDGGTASDCAGRSGHRIGGSERRSTSRRAPELGEEIEAGGQGGRAAGSGSNVIARTKRTAARDGSVGCLFLLQAAPGVA